MSCKNQSVLKTYMANAFYYAFNTQTEKMVLVFISDLPAHFTAKQNETFSKPQLQLKGNFIFPFHY